MNKKVRKKSISNKKKKIVKKTQVKKSAVKRNTNVSKKSTKKDRKVASVSDSTVNVKKSTKDKEQIEDGELAKEKIDEKKKASSKKSQSRKDVNSNVSKSKTVKTKSNVSKKNEKDKNERLSLEEKYTKKKVKDASNLEDNKDKEILESDVKELSEDERKLRIRKINIARYSIVSILSLVCVFCIYKLGIFGIDTYQNHLDSKKLIESVLIFPTLEDGSGEQNIDEFNIEEVVIDFNTLLSTNSDTVGWMIFNNQVINNPVVHTSDNSYYLSHNFNKRSSSYGTIFMDYRNSSFDDRNVVFFGHDNLDRSMFGSLSDVFKVGFFDTENADIIYIFDTNNNLLKYQIFSYYIINSEEYYITTYFGSDDSFQKFINTIKSRSYSDRGIEVTVNDKILTLSTCAGFEGTSTRRVIHAKRID